MFLIESLFFCTSYSLYEPLLWGYFFLSISFLCSFSPSVPLASNQFYGFWLAGVNYFFLFNFSSLLLDTLLIYPFLYLQSLSVYLSFHSLTLLIFMLFLVFPLYFLFFAGYMLQWQNKGVWACRVFDTHSHTWYRAWSCIPAWPDTQVSTLYQVFNAK